MTNQKIRNLLQGIDHQSLEELRAAVLEEHDSRRETIDINSIEPGMPDQLRRKVQAEISRLLREREQPTGS